MTGIQVVAIGVGAVMLFITYTALRRNELRLYEFGVWSAVWASLILVSVFADRLRAVVAPLQVARLLDLVIITALIALAVMLLNLNRSLRTYERRLTRLVRELALESSAHDEPGEAVED